MRLLLDTHTLIWAVDDPSQLSARADALSCGTWANDHARELGGPCGEMSIKVGLHELDLSLPFRQWMTQAIADLGLTILPITVEYAEVQAGLPFHHKDPFDRLLVAQAMVEGIAVVSGESASLMPTGLIRIW